MLPLLEERRILGMKGVDTIAKVRREFYQHGRTIKQIARDLHVARNTVRKILRTDATTSSPL